MCAAAAASALALTACLPGSSGSEESSGSSSSSSDDADSDSSGDPADNGDGPTPYEADETETFDEPQQRELTAKEAERALPTREDMPDESYVQDVSEQRTERWTYDPPECAAVELATASATSFTAKHRTTREYARFSQSQVDGNGFLGVWISSHAAPYPLAYFDEAGESLAECAEFTTISPQGHEFPKKTQAISAPRVEGTERVFAVRIIGSSSNTDRLYARSGRNLITVMQTSAKGAPFDERLLTKHAQAVIDDLKKSA